MKKIFLLLLNYLFGASTNKKNKDKKLKIIVTNITMIPFLSKTQKKSMTIKSIS